MLSWPATKSSPRLNSKSPDGLGALQKSRRLASGGDELWHEVIGSRSWLCASVSIRVTEPSGHSNDGAVKFDCSCCAGFVRGVSTGIVRPLNLPRDAIPALKR